MRSLLLYFPILQNILLIQLPSNYFMITHWLFSTMLTKRLNQKENKNNRINQKHDATEKSIIISVFLLNYPKYNIIFQKEMKEIETPTFVQCFQLSLNTVENSELFIFFPEWQREDVQWKTYHRMNQKIEVKRQLSTLKWGW